ncbi:MAG TPA: hypothetical protein VF142_23590 [Longimicrobium sp.]
MGFVPTGHLPFPDARIAAARRPHVASRRGGARDSLAGHPLSVTPVAWLGLLRPHFGREHRLPLLPRGGLALRVPGVALAPAVRR